MNILKMLGIRRKNDVDILKIMRIKEDLYAVSSEVHEFLSAECIRHGFKFRAGELGGDIHFYKGKINVYWNQFNLRDKYCIKEEEFDGEVSFCSLVNIIRTSEVPTCKE